jgi:glycosyltransferase involved in cell wall biosynthesis
MKEKEKKIKILVLVDRFPLVPDYSPSTWMIRSLEELSEIAEIEVISIINVLPRLRNLRYQGRDRKWLSAALRRATLRHDSFRFVLNQYRVFNSPATLSWKLLPRLISCQMIPRLFLKYNKKQYDAVLVHGTYPVGNLGIRLARMLGLPCLLVNHEGYDLYRTYFTPAASKEVAAVLNRATLLVALSPNHQKELHQYFPTQPIQMLSHGIDVSPDVTTARDKSSFHVLTVSRLDGFEKQIDLLLEGFAEFVRKRHIPATLTIAGDGSERASLQARARQLGIEERITFSGWVPSTKLPELFQTHHVFFCASSHETFCYAALEAVASGLPVIGMPTVGILSEIVSLFPEETALSELTSACIAEKLSSFYDAKNRWQQIADVMLQVVKERFTWMEHRKAMHCILHQFLGNHDA